MTVILFVYGRVKWHIHRSGRHEARSDDEDYQRLYSQLCETRAHQKIAGRKFGNFSYPENVMDDERFDQVGFYRWIVGKNKEAKAVLKAKKKKS